MSLFSSSDRPSFPGSWMVPSPRSEWLDPPTTLNPNYYSSEGRLSSLGITESFKNNAEAEYGIELQSLKSFLNPPSPTGSSPLSTQIFSPEIPHIQTTPSVVEPHMTEPLLPDSAPLDFSCLLPQAGATTAQSAGPMAGCWDLNPNNRTDENVLLHVLSEDFERVSKTAKGPVIIAEKRSWKTLFKELTIGLSSLEYHRKYYWAKYTHEEEL